MLAMPTDAVNRRCPCRQMLSESTDAVCVSRHDAPTSEDAVCVSIWCKLGQECPAERSAEDLELSG
eukprot:2701770-Rhodomonas_salina.1